MRKDIAAAGIEIDDVSGVVSCIRASARKSISRSALQLKVERRTAKC
jgi:hypothetical protein